MFLMHGSFLAFWVVLVVILVQSVIIIIDSGDLPQVTRDICSDSLFRNFQMGQYGTHNLPQNILRPVSKLA